MFNVWSFLHLFASLRNQRYMKRDNLSIEKWSINHFILSWHWDLWSLIVHLFQYYYVNEISAYLAFDYFKCAQIILQIINVFSYLLFQHRYLWGKVHYFHLVLPILQNILLYLFICVNYKQTTTFLHLSGHNSQGRT